MIRVLVHSRDTRLLPALSASLHPEFEVRVEGDAELVKELTSSEHADVLILDLDSDYSESKNYLALFDELEPSGVPIVVMSDDKTKSTALDLMSRSSCDYFRKPPSLVELRVILRRAYEHACLKRELRAARESLRCEPACDQLVGQGSLSNGVYNLIR